MRALAMATTSCGVSRVRVLENGFPSFLPRDVEKIRDPSARELAKRIERIPVKVTIFYFIFLLMWLNFRLFSWKFSIYFECVLFPWMYVLENGAKIRFFFFPFNFGVFLDLLFMFVMLVGFFFWFFVHNQFSFVCFPILPLILGDKQFS